MKRFSFFSEDERVKDFTTAIKERDIAIRQKHMYMQNNAHLFYASKEIQLETAHWQDDYTNFIKEHVLKPEHKNKRIAFISIGAGKDDMGKVVVRNMCNENFSIDYYGVDSSEEMLELLRINFEKESFSCTPVLADFSDYDFKSNLKKVLQTEYDFKIFAFFGGTVGSITLTNVVDTFQNILAPGDYLWSDCVLQKDTTHTARLERFNYYLSFFEDKDVSEFLLGPLKELGIENDHGELFLKTKLEKVTGSVLYIFGFMFKNKVKIKYSDNDIIFLPNEEMLLLHIRDYQALPFISFFEEHNLKSLAHWQKSTLGQFLFQK